MKVQLKRMNDPELDKQFQLIAQAVNGNLDPVNLNYAIIEGVVGASATVTLGHSLGRVPAITTVTEGPVCVVYRSVDASTLRITNLTAALANFKILVM